MTTALSSRPPAYPRLRRFAIDLAITAVFNVVIALVVTYVIRIHDVFSVNLVISMCIGLLMVSFIDGGRLLLWGTGKPPLLPFILLFILALPSAQFLGNEIASLILGIPSQEFASAMIKNRTGFVVLFVLTCLSITLFFWNRGVVEQLRAEAEADKARTAAVEKQAMQTQLHMLQAQVEPHMLFNTLANLQGLIAVDPSRAQHMLDQLIHYLRATLLASRAGQATLAQEYALIEAYLGLMQVRMGARLSYTLQLPDALRDMRVPPLLLQPLVENAIKHGLEPKMDGGRINVQASCAAGMLTLRVCDTGLGLDAAPADTSSTHVGIANMRERLAVLYQDRAALSLIPNTPSGVIAEITIPS